VKENRVHSRVDYRVLIRCLQYYDPDGILVRFDDFIQIDVFDVSLGGIGVITKSQFPVNSILVFTLYLEDVPYSSMAQVRWCTSNEYTNRYGLELLGVSNMLHRHIKALIKGESLLID